MPQALRKAAQTEGVTSEDFREAQMGGIRAQWSADDLVANETDSSSAGHLYLAQQRQSLHYLRLIEHEMPKLVGECNTRQ
jgi:small subunit ribosomal protein S35